MPRWRRKTGIANAWFVEADASAALTELLAGYDGEVVSASVAEDRARDPLGVYSSGLVRVVKGLFRVPLNSYCLWSPFGGPRWGYDGEVVSASVAEARVRDPLGSTSGCSPLRPVKSTEYRAAYGVRQSSSVYERSFQRCCKRVP